LNGYGPYRFLLDSGAQTNTMESGVARDIGLQSTFRVELATIAGVVLVPGGHVDEVQLGDIRVSGPEFIVHSLDAIHALDPTIRGVLGQEFLSRFDYLIDVQDHSLHLGAAAPRSGSRVDLELDGGRILLPTNFGRLVLDSGTDTLVLFDRAADTNLEMRTFSGSTPASSREPETVMIAGYGLRTVPSVSVARPRAAHEDGLLPIIAFKSIYVSNSEKYVIVDPRW